MYKLLKDDGLCGHEANQIIRIVSTIFFCYDIFAIVIGFIHACKPIQDITSHAPSLDHLVRRINWVVGASSTHHKISIGTATWRIEDVEGDFA